MTEPLLHSIGRCRPVKRRRVAAQNQCRDGRCRRRSPVPRPRSGTFCRNRAWHIATCSPTFIVGAACSRDLQPTGRDIYPDTWGALLRATSHHDASRLQIAPTAALPTLGHACGSGLQPRLLTACTKAGVATVLIVTTLRRRDGSCAAPAARRRKRPRVLPCPAPFAQQRFAAGIAKLEPRRGGREAGASRPGQAQPFRFRVRAGTLS